MVLPVTIAQTSSNETSKIISIRITLTPTLLIGVLYTIITLMVGFAGVVKEM